METIAKFDFNGSINKKELIALVLIENKNKTELCELVSPDWDQRKKGEIIKLRNLSFGFDKNTKKNKLIFLVLIETKTKAKSYFWFWLSIETQTEATQT